MSGIDNRAHLKRKFQRQKNLYIFSAVVIIIVAALICVVKVFDVDLRGYFKSEPTTTVPVTSTTTVPETTEPTTELSTVPTTSASSTTGTTAVTATGTTTAAPAPVTTVPFVGSTSAIVPESAAVDDSYFDDAAFLGDSRLAGFVEYNDLAKSSNYARVSIAINTVRTKKVIQHNGKLISPFEALQKDKSFNKIYLKFGLNECGWPYPENFIQMYSDLIDDIRKINPKTIIYVQSVLPVSATAAVKRAKDGIDKAHILACNERLKQMAADKNVYYLDVYSAFADKNGYLSEDAAVDGIHLNADYCHVWYGYLKTHTAQG